VTQRPRDHRCKPTRQSYDRSTHWRLSWPAGFQIRDYRLLAAPREQERGALQPGADGGEGRIVQPNEGGATMGRVDSGLVARQRRPSWSESTITAQNPYLRDLFQPAASAAFVFLGLARLRRRARPAPRIAPITPHGPKVLALLERRACRNSCDPLPTISTTNRSSAFRAWIRPSAAICLSV
jgi:hypothetical protein